MLYRAHSARAVLAIALFLLGSFALFASPRVEAQIDPVPRQAPDFVPPELFEGFEPLFPGPSGLSPLGRFLVVQDVRGLRIVRVANGETVFREAAPERAEIGFDFFDRRAYLIENQRQTYRFRFIDPSTGFVLLDLRLTERPEIRLNVDGSLNVLLRRYRNRTQALVFNGAGLVTYRRFSTGSFQIGINLFAPVVALVDRRAGSRAEIVVVNADLGRITYRTSTSDQFEAGFEPFGPAFVFARATSPSSFRVRMVNGLNGRFLTNRTFFGPLNAGFTPDSTFLGVKSRSGFSDRVYLFQTATGRIVFLGR